ncbi:MAG: hypothetical protein ACJAY1_001708, partial [Glaciecola sp.]
MGGAAGHPMRGWPSSNVRGHLFSSQQRRQAHYENAT